MARPKGRHEPTPKSAKSVEQFCEDYGISRRTFENWEARGVTPAIMQPVPFGRKFITREAEDEWKRLRSQTTEPKMKPVRKQPDESLAQELRDSLSQEIMDFLASGGDSAALIGVLGYLLETSVKAMSNELERDYARTAIHNQICSNAKNRS